MNLGTVLYEKSKNFEEAETIFKRVLEIDPNQMDTLVRYGDLLLSVKKDYEEAEKIFVRTLKNDPNDVKILEKYGNFLADVRNDHKRAEDVRTRASAVVTKIETTFTNLRERSNSQASESMVEASPSKKKKWGVQ